MNEPYPDNPRILIVDDETKNIQVLGTLLKQKGYYINVAQNGRSALETAREVLPDMILLDIMMPGPDGFEVCGELKSAPATKDIPVIFMTGKSDTEDIVRGFEAGAADYISKPFKSAELLARLRTHLNLRTLHLNLEEKNRRLSEEILEHQRTGASLRESEERFRSIVEHSTDPIFLMDSIGNILDANPATTERLGYDKAELLTLNIMDIDKQFAENKVKNVTAEQFFPDMGLPTETAYIRKDGTVFPAEVRMFPIPLNGKNVTVTFARDILYRKERETERMKMKKLESLGIMAGGLAHDYNNLLFIIQGYTELIANEIPLDSTINGHVREILNAASRGTDVTQKLMIFSKGGEPVRKKQSVHELLENLRLFLKMPPEIHCNIRPDDSLLQSEMDENQMRQVLLNLIDNAREAMPAGGTITVSARNISYDKEEVLSGIRIKEGKYIEISVMDQGSGIAEKHLTEIFDPYFSTKERGIHKGQGMGLAVVYSVVRKHQGYIHVKSGVPFGSIFTILLPAAEEIPEHRPAVRPTDTELRTSVRKILLMDDDEMVLAMMTHFLDNDGFTVETARNGEEALEKYQQAQEKGQPFDAAIIDLIIKKGMNGKETMEALLSLDPNVKAVISSGYHDDPVMADYRKYGFCDVIPKPYHPKKIREILENIFSE